jgi:hypothetical protein
MLARTDLPHQSRATATVQGVYNDFLISFDVDSRSIRSKNALALSLMSAPVREQMLLRTFRFAVRIRAQRHGKTVRESLRIDLLQKRNARGDPRTGNIKVDGQFAPELAEAFPHTSNSHA